MTRRRLPNLHRLRRGAWIAFLILPALAIMVTFVVVPIASALAFSLFDWQGLCLAPPALDAATFLGRLRREPARSPGTAEPADHLAAIFRREFLRRHPAVSPHDLAVYEALILTDTAVRTVRWPGRHGQMVKQPRV